MSAEPVLVKRQPQQPVQTGRIDRVGLRQVQGSRAITVCRMFERPGPTGFAAVILSAEVFF